MNQTHLVDPIIFCWPDAYYNCISWPVGAFCVLVPTTMPSQERKIQMVLKILGPCPVLNQSTIRFVSSYDRVIDASI